MRYYFDKESGGLNIDVQNDNKPCIAIKHTRINNIFNRRRKTHVILANFSFSKNYQETTNEDKHHFLVFQLQKPLII